MNKGLDNVSVLAELHDADRDIISTMCTNVRKRAGQISDSSWTAPEVAAGQPAPIAPMVPRPGYSIPIICDQRLALAAYSASVYTRIGRVVETGILNCQRLIEMKNHKNAVENHNDPESLPVSRPTSHVPT